MHVDVSISVPVSPYRSHKSRNFVPPARIQMCIYQNIEHTIDILFVGILSFWNVPGKMRLQSSVCDFHQPIVLICTWVLRALSPCPKGLDIWATTKGSLVGYHSCLGWIHIRGWLFFILSIILGSSETH